MSAVFNHKYYGWYEEKEETFNTGVESRLIKVKDTYFIQFMLKQCYNSYDIDLGRLLYTAAHRPGQTIIHRST